MAILRSAFPRRLLAHGACAVLGGSIAAYASGVSGGAVCDAAGKHIDPWVARWKANNTAWHKTEPHPMLVKFRQTLLPTGKEAIFFPLCGKAVDMPLLASAGHAVVGVDCAVAALEQTLAEHGGKVLGTTSARGFQSSEVAAGGATFKFVVGDFFAMTPDTAGTFDAAFDRGSLVAIDPELRERYAAALAPLVRPGGRILLVTVFHDPFKDGRLGPPFSVDDADVRRLFGAAFDVKMLQEEDAMLGETRGCTYFKERAYLLTRKTSGWRAWLGG